MKKIIPIIIFVILLTCCAKYEPVVDTKGRSKFETSNASEISDDLLHCKHLAKKNSSFWGNFGYWLSSTDGSTKYENMFKKCMEGRNHQVLN